MEKEVIIEGNKLIAEFMEIQKCDRCNDCGKYKFGSGVYYSSEEMSYNSHWDWLMPVVYKIESFHLIVEISCEECYISSRYVEDEKLPWLSSFPSSGIYSNQKTKIEATWIAIIGFIEIYNKIK